MHPTAPRSPTTTTTSPAVPAQTAAQRRDNIAALVQGCEGILAILGIFLTFFAYAVLELDGNFCTSWYGLLPALYFFYLLTRVRLEEMEREPANEMIWPFWRALSGFVIVGILMGVQQLCTGLEGECPRRRGGHEGRGGHH